MVRTRHPLRRHPASAGRPLLRLSAGQGLAGLAGPAEPARRGRFGQLRTAGILLAGALTVTVALVWPGAPRAATPSAEPISLVVPFAAGGPTDAVARELAPALARALGEPVELKHLPGAGGTRGALAVAQARADGRTLLLHHIGMATAPALYRALPYRPQRDFTPLGRVVDMPMTIVVRQDFPGRDGADTVWLLRRPQAPWLVAYAGLGAASHLCGMLLSDALGVDLIQIPYQGTGPAIRDLRAGQVDMMCDQTSNTLAPIRAGEVRAVAVTAARRLPGLDDVPTTGQMGLPGLDLSIWHGLYLPAGAAEALVGRYARALASARRDPAFVEAMAAMQGVIPAAQAATPQALRRQLVSETRRWSAVIRRNGQQAD